MTKKQAQAEIAKIAKRLNRPFVEIAETIIEQTPNCRTAAIIKELIIEQKK